MYYAEVRLHLPSPQLKCQRRLLRRLCGGRGYGEGNSEGDYLAGENAQYLKKKKKKKNA